jgi:ABC-type multidrug transport system fused ATPase/permease subunit
MKDTLTNAALKLRVDQLQHQVDSLKQISTYKAGILEARLDQASDTVSNLSSLSTGFGTMYTIIGIIIALLTILIAIITVIVPVWLKRRTNKEIQKIRIQYDQKFTDIDEKYNDKTVKLNEVFVEKIESLDKQFKVDIEVLNQKFIQNNLDFSAKYKQSETQMKTHSMYAIAEAFKISTNFKAAIETYILALINWKKLDDIKNIKTCLSRMEVPFKKISKEEFDKINTSLNSKREGLDWSIVTTLNELERESIINEKYAILIPILSRLKEIIASKN